MIGKSQAVLLALLLALPTAFLGAAIVSPAFAQTNYSAWLKIVTDSWDGANYPGFNTPVRPVGVDFPGRYNATNVCVFLVHFKAGLTQWDPVIDAGRPNGTGFIQVSWPRAWDNVTIIVKARSYQGDCIGGDDPFKGIIVYWLTINPTASFRNKFGVPAGFSNASLGDDGIWQDASTGGYFDWTVDAPFNAGPIDVVTPANPATWGADFQADHNDPYGRNAWVAHAAYIFKLFHEHTWYATYDNLTYATIFIYDTDHTEPGSTQSLIQAAITGDDGQSRYTREIYPASAGRGEFDSRPGKFADNRLVPIPLQTINLRLKTPFQGGIADPEDEVGSTGFPAIEAPHLNATKRVWWETVLTNQTFYVGNEYNGTAGPEYAVDPGTGKTRPLFGAYPTDYDADDDGTAVDPVNPTHTQGGITGVPAGPFSLALNNTVDLSIAGFQVSGFEWDTTPTVVENVANFNNNTVFYARFCVQDADLKIQHFEVGDKMVNAEVTIDLKRTGDVQPYYLSHNILTTDNGGCTATPHKWPGYTAYDKLNEPYPVDDLDTRADSATWFDKMARFPNATNWGLRGSLNVSKAFDPRDDVSPVWRPGGYFDTQWSGDWRGPYTNGGKNWSALIPEITYMKTRQLSDDINYDGFNVNVRWAGGSRNSYMAFGARPVLVDSIRVPNPYAIATLYNYATEAPWGGWVFPTTTLANNKLLVYVHTADTIEIDIDRNGDGTFDYTSTLTDVEQKTLEITGAFTVTMLDNNLDGVWDSVTIDPDTDRWLTLNIVENRTDPWVDYTNVTQIQLEQALVTLKKHDSLFNDGVEVVFAAPYGGVLDYNADGLDLQTDVGALQVTSGPLELEIWPGAPGDNQQKILISSHDVSVIVDGDTRADFTGTLLAYGAVIAINIYEREEQTWELTDTSTTSLTLGSLDARPRSPSPLGPEVGGRPVSTGGTSSPILFGSGIVKETLPKTMITGMSLFSDHTITLSVIQEGDGSVGLYKGWFVNGTDAVAGFTGSANINDMQVDDTITISSKVVPLQDFSNDDREYDDWIFGGYDDFALTGSGVVYITAWVHDIGFKLLDNMGNTLPAARTTVTLTGGSTGTLAVPKSGVGTDPDRLVGGLQFSYKIHGDGWAVYYQLPGDHAYGVTVTFDGAEVYSEPTEIPKLIKTEMIELVTNVVKAKLVFVDCEDKPVGGAWVRYTDPSGRTLVTKITDHGELDLGFTAGGTMVVRGLWWKGVWVPFDKASIGSTEIPIASDGSVTIVLDKNIDSPPVLRAVINDFIFTPWDFNMDNRIPRLNITLMWVGEAPTTGERLYFVETLDPTGDTWDGNLPENDLSDDGNPRNDYNTSVTLHQWFSYKIEYNQGGITTNRGLKTYATVKYIFYQMPPTYYNITVTTTPHLFTDGHNGQDWGTPATSKWPGRTDAPVEYEAKILWGSPDASTFSLKDLRNPPLEAWRKATYSASTGKWSFSGGPDGDWAAYANDRIVLRVFGTIGGTPVTDPNLNPGGVGNQTSRVCGPRNIDLITWAHTFSQRIVDGDFDYLNEARRIGNASYNIVNDNGQKMEQYYPDVPTFSTDFVSKWTQDTLLTTWLKADSQYSSNIWWNGTYSKENLRFLSYVYPLEFSRGEQPWARFYDRVGLTGTGTLTTEDGPMNEVDNPEVTPNSFLVNRFFNTSVPRTQNATSPRHNFTVVGNEGLWNQQRWRWERAVARGLVPEVPTRPYSLVFEKEVVTVPIPVGFITLSLKDEDLARAIPYAVVELSIFSRHTRTTPPTSTSIATESTAVYKVGREGNLTLLYPTQEMMENIISLDGVNPYVVNYTLTVYWYLNSSIVYKDAFNLTKRGYTVDKVAIADVTFVLAISANKDRPVKDLYARIWWLNVTDPTRTVFPGRIAVDHAKKTWTYTAVPETRGAARWTTGQLTLPWLPTSERFTKSDWDLVFSTSANRWVYTSVTRSWDIPYPSYDDGRMIDGWPYSPQPTGYYRALTLTQNARIQYRISVWSDQLPIDPSLTSYGKGAWSTAAPNPATGTNYELVWTRLSTGDTSPPVFRFAWMLFGHAPYDITFYRGPDAVGMFQPIPGYALTRTWTATPTPGSKTVAIKLNATDVDIPVFWQVGDLELGTYDCGPLVGYIVKGRIEPPKGATFGPRTIDAVTTAGTITIGDKTVPVCVAGKPVGLVTVTSGDTPSTVIWGGSSLVIEEVSPPPSIWYNDGTGQAGADNPNRGTTSNYWRNWVSQAIDPITGQPVNLHVGDQQQIPGVDLGIQYMGYGRPYEGVARETTVIAWSNDPDNRAHRPFIKMFEFQNVSARITDFNGRPLPGAFYQIIDAQTGKSAAWSYAGPDGRIVPMPIRKPGGVFIQRVLYLGQGANGEPTWPVNSYARWPIAYDSRDDETTQETQKPDIPLGFAYTAEAGPWPNGPGWLGPEVCSLVGDHWYEYYSGEWLDTSRGEVFDQRPLSISITESFASCPPAGWGRSFDVITRIFDLRVRFVYGDAQRPADPAYVFSAPSLALSDDFIIRGQGAIFEAKRLARSSYDIVALWPDANGEEVGRRTFDISTTNVGTVEGTVVLALRDVSFNVVDRQGRPLSGARVSVSPDLVRDEDIQLRPDSIFTILRIPDGRTYDFTVEWTSPFGTTARAAVRETPAGLQSRGSITMPVDDVTLTVVDFDGRPVAGAAIRFAGQQVGTTDSQGIIIIGQVPLDNEYQIEVTKDGTTIGGDRVRFTASRTSATIQAGVYDITVLVKGAAGQPIQGAIVELQRGGTTVATAATDASGSAVFSKVVGADYSVKASYEQFSSSANVARGTRSATLVLDLYTVVLGVPMTLATFLALIIGLILLVIVIVVIVSEYIRWRGRRLGIYPAAPPKK